jgi:creatinine amidohydrolase/Fe(II)-dependent formamide hydrolase-like protein
MMRILAACVLSGLLAIAPRALAAGPSSVFLEDQTSSELRDQIRDGTTTILVPIGGTEQNGPDMVLGKHNVRVKLLAEKIAAQLGHTVVAPVIAYVPEGSITPPTAHMRFAGTISIPDQAFEQMLEGAAKSFAQHGFRDIVFLGDHGGYQADLRLVADQLNRQWAAGHVRAHAVGEYYRAAASDFPAILKARGYSQAEIGTHAGLADTSLALAVDPHLVHLQAMQQGPKRGPQEGVYGDPRRSSAELGQLGVDVIVSRSVEAIRAAIARR